MSESLADRKFLNTRPREQLGELSSLLLERSAVVHEFPMLELLELPFELNLAPRDWLVFTSANGVDAFHARAQILGVECERVACVGEKTAQRARNLGYSVEFVSTEANSEGLARQFVEFLKREQPSPRVHLLRAKKASVRLPEILREAGIETLQAAVYDTKAPSYSANRLVELRTHFSQRLVDMAIFTSSQAVEHCREFVGDEVKSLPAASIGPRTTATLREFGIEVVVEAGRQSMLDLVLSIERFFRSHSS